MSLSSRSSQRVSQVTAGRLALRRGSHLGQRRLESGDSELALLQAGLEAPHLGGELQRLARALVEADRSLLNSDRSGTNVASATDKASRTASMRVGAGGRSRGGLDRPIVDRADPGAHLRMSGHVPLGQEVVTHSPVEEGFDPRGHAFRWQWPCEGEVPADFVHDLAPVPQERVVGSERAAHTSRGDLGLEEVAQPQQEGLCLGEAVSLGKRGRDLQRVPDRDHGERGDLEPSEDVLPQRHESAHPRVLDDPERLLAVGAFECLGQAFTEARGGHRREPSRLGDAEVVERRVRGAE